MKLIVSSIINKIIVFKRVLLFVLVAVLLNGCLTGSQKVEKESKIPKRPNVIFIYADDLGRGLLSVEGQKIIKTPNIDKLAHEGMRFENAYGSMFCAPARASLISGYHDAHKGKWKITAAGAYKKILTGQFTLEEIEQKLEEQTGPISEDEVFLAEVMKSAGYVTGEVGKLEWGFSATDKEMKRHGWDYYYGYLDHGRCHGFYPPFLFENGEMVTIEGNTRNDCGKTTERETEAAFKARWDMEGKTTYSQNLFLEKILGFIRENKDKPFFLYHPTQLPHGPVSIPEVHSDYINDDRLTQIEKEYASMVKMLDDHVGIIMQELKTLGIDDNTMVVFGGDNGHEIYYTKEGRILKPVRNMQTGEFFDDVNTKYYSDVAGDVFDGNDGMAGVKRTNWEGGVRVPLILRWPGKIKEGVTSEALVANYDFMATMADLVGYDLPKTKDGKSYLPELLGEKTQGHDYVVYASFMGPSIVANDGWKLRYFAPKDIFQLYYLPNDYQEKNNIIDSNPEKVEELKAALIKACDGDISNGLFGIRKSTERSIK
jgi:arylsulfatase A-like enzyme